MYWFKFWHLKKTLPIEYPKNKPGNWQKSSNGIQEHYADILVSESMSE